MVKNNLKIFPTSFSSIFHLHCYSQVNSISYVLFRSFCSQQILLKCFLSLYRYQKVFLFMEISVIFKKQLKKISYKFFVTISFALLRWSYFNFLRSFQIFLFLTSLTQMPSLNRHEKVTRFMEFSANGKKTIEKIIPYKLFVIISIALLRWSYFNFLRSFQIILFLTIFTQMPSLHRHEKVTRFMELSASGKKNNWKIIIFSYKLFVIISIALIRWSYFNFLRSFQINLFLTVFTQLPSLNRHEKVTRFMEFCANVKKTT